MRKFLNLALLIFFLSKGIAFAQPTCAGAISFSANPAPVNGTYAPGTVVNYCITMNGFTQAGTNWFEGFDINAGAGWAPGSIGPNAPAPANCGGAVTGGAWIWLNSSTSSVSGITFGPGYFFDWNNNGVAGNDFGDAGSCSWTMCFHATVGNTCGASLSMGVATLSDGLAGSWASALCDGLVYTALTPAAITVSCCTLTGAITAQTNVFCFGASTGAATITGSLGTAPYQYSFAGGAYSSNNSFSNLAAGAYTVTIQDAAGCTFNVPLNITQPATGLTSNIVSQVNVDCNGNSTGSVDVSASTGVPPYQFGINGGPQSTATNFSSLAAGNYVVNIIDASGCTAVLNVVITEPPVLSIAIVNQTNIDCFGNTNGSIEVTGNGGTAPYTYAFNGAAPAAQTLFNNLAAGNYTVQITDANNCTGTLLITITQPLAPLAASLVSNIPVDCFGAATGELTIVGVDGTGPYQYSIFGGAVSPNGVFSNLMAGTYTVIVEDANGCTASITETITQPALALNASLSSQSNVLCFGGASGSLSFTAANGTPTYTFSLAGNSNANGTFNNLPTGNYVVTVTDANGCTTQANATLLQPNAALGGFILSQTNVLCSGTTTGAFEILGSNGTPPYSFTNNGVTNTTGVFSNLAAGTYNVTITDQNGCTFIQAVNLISPNALSSTIVNQTPVSCFNGNNGALTVNGVNGTGPYSFSLNGNNNASGIFNGLIAGNYNVLVTDLNGCTVTQSVTITEPSAAVSGSIATQTNVSCFGLSDASFTITAAGGTPVYSYNLAGSVNASGSFNTLGIGNYLVTITDANNCTIIVPVLITQPLALSPNLVAQQNVSCFGGNNGQINAGASGGTLPYSFTLNGTTNTNGLFPGLTAGAYTVVVSDQNSCTASLNVVITEPALALSAALISQTNVICFGAATGSVTLAANGGTAAYQYGITGTGLSASSTITGLAAGAFAFTIQDANGCTTTLNTIITQPAQPNQVTLISQTDILCFGGNTGLIEVSASNGTTPYSFSIGGTTNASGIFNGLTSGFYTVLVTDANNCTADIQVTLLQPPSTVSITVVSQINPLCNGYSNGSIAVSANGGVAPGGYNFSWNTAPPVLSSQLLNVPAGNYMVTVTDGNACTQTLNVLLTQPNFQVNVIGNYDLCKGQDSLMTFTSLDGAPPVTYTLTDLGTGTSSTGSTQNILPALTTSFQMVATDNNGCISPPMNFTVTINDVPEAIFNADITTGCLPVCVNFSSTPGPAGTVYNWSLGDGSTYSASAVNHCYNEAGSFEVGLQAVSPAGCSSFISIPDYIQTYEIPLVDFTPSPRVINQSEALISFDNNTLPEYTFTWDFGDQMNAGNVFNPSHKYLNPGEFCIVLTAENEAGCISEHKECITVLPDFHFFIPSSFTPNGDGVNDTFRGEGISIGHTDLKIYSRWGNLVFDQNSSETIEWDGIGFDQDSYTYQFTIADIFGKSKVYTGSVTLIR
jgi:gliding motility-associated-like protein